MTTPHISDIMTRLACVTHHCLISILILMPEQRIIKEGTHAIFTYRHNGDKGIYFNFKLRGFNNSPVELAITRM